MKKKSTLLSAWKIPLPVRCMSALMLFMWCSASAQVQLIKDINTWGDPSYSEFGFIADGGNGKLFFSARGLYVTEGTPETTQKIYDIGNMSAVFSFNNELIFAGDDGTGLALWKSNGTTAGTVKLKQIAPYNTYMHDGGDFTLVQGTLFFTASDAAGMELWKTDGTATGTVRVKDIKPGASSSNPVELTAVGDKLFFVAPSGNNKGIELWVSDGTSAGTVLVHDINPGSSSSDPKHLTGMNGKVFFTAKDGLHGIELWQSDGTSAGTHMVKDIRPGAANASAGKLTEVNGTLFFEAHDGIHGKELWKSDGTEAGTVLVKDVTPGPGSDAGFAIDHLDNFIAYNGELYFTAFQKGHRLWKSNGTAEGTIPLTPAGEIEFGFLQPDMEIFNNELFFLAQSDFDVTQLWKTNGTVAGTRPVNPALADFVYGTYAKIEPCGSTLYLLGSSTWDMSDGISLLRSNGTLSGTEQIFDLQKYTLGSIPSDLTVAGNYVYFSALQDEEYYRALWRSDGTESGTEMVSDFHSVDYLHDFDGNLLFSGSKNYGVDGSGLWISDGTDAGTTLLTTPGYPGFEITYPGSMARLGDEMIFGGGDSNTGRELWKTDGTAAGTVLLKDIYPGAQHSSASFMVSLGNQAIFAASSPNEGNELWKTDGTEAGTELLKDIRPYIGSSFPRHLTVAGSRLYFAADDGNGIELWTSDGTTAGTTRVSDISTGNSQVDHITPVGENVLFTAVDTQGMRALWFTTGLPGGTFLLKDFLPGNEIIWPAGKNDQYTFWLVTAFDNSFSAPTAVWRTDGTTEGTVKVTEFHHSPSATAFATIDNIVYFQLDLGPSLWRTDGTTCGTYPVSSVLNSSEMVELNGKLFFEGVEYPDNSNSPYGAELYSYTPEAAPSCNGGGRVAQTQETTEEFIDDEIVSVYPNPSRHQFTMTIAGKEDDRYEIEIITINGKRVELHRDLAYNKAYQFGAQWGGGIYIMKAFVNGKMMTRKVVKTN
jgi:ELWxxDGT repeat protein